MKDLLGTVLKRALPNLASHKSPHDTHRDVFGLPSVYSWVFVTELPKIQPFSIPQETETSTRSTPEEKLPSCQQLTYRLRCA